jgi:glycerol-3-phosphate dehydrogenase
MSEVGETELTETELHGLFHKYGSNALDIIAKIDLKNADRTLAILLAELNYAAENEMVCELSDFLIRRTGRLYFEKPIADKYAPALNKELAKLLGLTREQTEKSLQTYLKESDDVLSFKEQ